MDDIRFRENFGKGQFAGGRKSRLGSKQIEQSSKRIGDLGVTLDSIDEHVRIHIDMCRVLGFNHSDSSRSRRHSASISSLLRNGGRRRAKISAMDGRSFSGVSSSTVTVTVEEGSTLPRISSGSFEAGK